MASNIFIQHSESSFLRVFVGEGGMVSSSTLYILGKKKERKLINGTLSTMKKLEQVLKWEIVSCKTCKKGTIKYV